VRYPLNSISLSINVHPFTWGLHTHRRRDLTEAAKRAGTTQWWVRIGCLTIAYHRMV